MTGIYQIRNLVNDKVYIGSAVDFGKRWNSHICSLNDQHHHSQKLQRAWDKYGIDAFKFEILEELVFPVNYPKALVKEYLLGREQYYLDTILHANLQDSYFELNGYNICRVAGSNLGFKHSYNSIQKRIRTRIEKRSSCKYDESLIKEIIQYAIDSDKTFNEIGRIYNIHGQYIRNILLGKVWKNINLEPDLAEKLKRYRLRSFKSRSIGRGENNNLAILREFDVLEIIKLLNNRTSLSIIAKKYNVSIHCIKDIQQNRSWKHLKRDKIYLGVRTKLNKENIVKIKELLNKGESLTTIASLYNVGVTTIHDIKSNKTWASLEEQHNGSI